MTDDPKEQQADPNPIIGTIADVTRWLRAEGYCAPGKDKPSKNSKKLYEDRKKGLFKAADLKNITQIEVEAYITRAMLMQRGVKRADEAEDLNIQKLRWDTRKAKADAERREFENERDRGLWIKKQESELQIAIKIGAFDAAFRHLVRISAHEVAHLLCGDVKRCHLLCDYYYPRIDDLLDQMGKMEEIQVVIKRQKGDDN